MDAEDEVLDAEETNALAEEFFDAWLARDIDRLDAIYDPDFRIWRNFHPFERDKEQQLRVTTTGLPKIENLRYEGIRRDFFPGGFVQQHNVRGTGPLGELDHPACLVVHTRGRRFLRIDEYSDLAHLVAAGIELPE